MSASVDLELLRASLLLESDPAGAAERASRILSVLPGNIEASLLLATASRKLGQPAEAVRALKELSDAHPASALLNLELGRAYAAAGARPEALAAFSRLVRMAPELAEGWQELAAQQFASGNDREGDIAYARYLALADEPLELRDAVSALSENRLEGAETILRQRLRRFPGDAPALRMLAEIALRREQEEEAERYLKDCLAAAPGFAAARFELARLLNDQHRHLEVLPLTERLLASDPDNVDYLSLKAQALRLLGENKEAMSLMERAIAAHPQDDRAWLLYGHLLREAGLQARAIAMYRRALNVRASCGRAYSSLADLKTFRFAQSDIEAMQTQLGHGSLQSSDRLHFEFALGKALEDEGQWEASFEHYARGNELHRATVAYDPDATTADVQRAKSVYSADFFKQRSKWGSTRVDPIFIVGLPRSGSTLLEQMLASHSQIEGTRELTDLPTVARDLMLEVSPALKLPYPEPVASLSSAQIAAGATRYLGLTQRYRILGRPRFVDKMLGNFAHVGLIHLLFPRAPIVDIRRHPLSTGFSCYKQWFARNLPFAYDLTEIGRYYRDYVDLMDHFDEVLPGRIHRVRYEELVVDPEGQLRSLLTYCGLPFEDQCMRFYENPRVVQTISSEQVRVPIYASSLEQWRHFEPWLTPLRQVLGEDLLAHATTEQPRPVLADPP